MSVHSRFITAAALFDGHDAAINIMRRILLAQGAEVIHLGHNRSVDEIVTAAIQEDAQAIAISSYQGGHMEYFKYMLDRLKDFKATHIKVFGGGGGTITLDEIRELEKYGVTKIFSPEDGRTLGLKGMIESMIQSTPVNPSKTIDWLKLTQFKEQTQNLAQALTVLELGRDGFSTDALKAHLKDYDELLSKIEATQASGVVVGMTGTGGAGKSSLTDELMLRILESDPKARVACLAIDPTRKKTGGALLGDRLRMNSLKYPRCFMRSLATRQENASISQSAKDSLSLLKAAGFDWIFLETGGIGQADTSIVGLVDINIYVMTAEFGAPTQLEKINMLDYADMVVLNKFDKSGALDALEDVRKQFRRNHLEFESIPTNQYPIFPTTASRFDDSGVNQAFNHLKIIAQSPTRRLQTKVPLAITHPKNTAVLPKNRTQYLSDIATSVEKYHERVEANALKLKTIDARSTLGSDTSLSEAVRKELSRTQDLTALDPDLKAIWDHFQKLEKEYLSDTLRYEVRNRTVEVQLVTESLSHQKIPKVVPPTMTSVVDRFRFACLENLPGYFPYTAGVFPLKRTQEDPKRQFAGEGGPEKTNRRFHLLCEGDTAKRLSTAFDSVTLYGENPDERPDIFGKIGESGVSVCSLDDMKKLYAGFDLCDPTTSVSMTINGPAPILLAFFFNTAIDQQVEKFTATQKRAPSAEEWQQIQAQTLKQVRGTVQADILKEDQAQNTCIFSTEFALRMMADIQEYFVSHEVRNYYSVSISGYHIAEAGANPISQLAFTLANGFTYVEYYLSRGMKIDDFAANFSFFFSNGLDPEYTVIGRVARRIWAIAMKYLYEANDRSQKLKYHIQTSGRSLHAMEISFNDIRTTLQAVLAYFDHCNSLHTNAYDEAVTTPTEESVRRAMAIQLIIAKEFGWAKNENPLQGSYFIDHLTNLVEKAVLEEFKSISLRGGVLGAMESHYQRSKIQEESMYYEKLKHSGELPIMGVNTFLPKKNSETSATTPVPITRATAEEKMQQIKNLRGFHAKHLKESEASLKELKEHIRAGKNIFEGLMKTARHCSLGQISQALYELGGQYRRNM